MNRHFDINKPGHSIKCKLYCNDIRSIGRLVLYGHGFAGNKENKPAERFAETLLSKGKDWAVLTFDWPAHGDDVKKVIQLDDCITYIEIILRYIRSQLHVDDIYAFGTSFGGFMFLKYISEYGSPFKKIALRCPAVNIYELMVGGLISNDNMEKLEKGRPVPAGFADTVMVNKQFLDGLADSDLSTRDFLDFADDIIIIHGTKDEVVDPAVVKDFAERNVIEFCPIVNADHRFQDYALMGAAINHIIEFFK